MAFIPAISSGVFCHIGIIEAEGIAEANNIIAGGLTEAYLTWYWIDNLDTHNSVIYVPIGDAGLPLFREVTETRRVNE